MSIRDHETLSRADFDAAVVRLRLNVSEIAKATGISRSYLSEFRNGDRKLRPENLAKLRDYFESKGLDFVDEPAADPEDDAPANPHPRLVAKRAEFCHFAVPPVVPDDVIASALDLMEDGDARLLALFKLKAERNEGLFGDGEYTDEVKAQLQEAFALLSCNYMVFRMLRGWPAFGMNPATETDPKTLRDVILATFAEKLTQAGLLAKPAGKPGEGDDTNAAPKAEKEAA